MPRAGRGSALWLILGALVFAGFAAVGFLGGTLEASKADLQTAGLIANPDCTLLDKRLGVPPLAPALEAGSAPRIRSDTAKGAVDQSLTSAGGIKIGRAEARQVPVAILDHALGAVDGLLGRSVLSRFDVTIAADHRTLRSKTNGPPT